MQTQRIPYRETGYFSSLICDLVEQHPTLKSRISDFPSLKSFQAQIEKKQSQFQTENRQQLVASLQQQYSAIEDKLQLEESLTLLAKPTTFTITTGHQLNLFTGPLYFIFKIVSTINLCKQLKQAYPEFDFVPVYWMATEDHDFEEISFFNFQSRKIKWTKESRGAVGRLSVNDLSPLLEVFEQSIGQNNAAKRLLQHIEASYRAASNLSEATLRLVHQLFGDQGLVILDADTPSLKKLFIPYINEELTKGSCQQHVNETIDWFKKDYSSQYTPQVNPRAINLFYLRENYRERIIATPSGFETVDTDFQFTEQEMKQEVLAHPERFSPNVLMRPLYQEVILPNLCYIGGGGELAYWLELKSFFDSQEILFPILLLRNSAVLVPQKAADKMVRLDLKPQDLFLKRTPLINKKIRQISNIDLNLQSLKDKLEEQFSALELLVNQTDKSFEGAVGAQRKKQFKGIDALEKRLLKAQKKKLVDHVERLSRLHESLFPGDSLQERYANFFEFYLMYGEDVIPQLLATLDPLELQFSWISLP